MMWFLKVNGKYFAMYETKEEAVKAFWFFKSEDMTDAKVEICKGRIVEVEE